jgi:hypothetical protein
MRGREGDNVQIKLEGRINIAPTSHSSARSIFGYWMTLQCRWQCTAIGATIKQLKESMTIINYDEKRREVLIDNGIL